MENNFGKRTLMGNDSGIQPRGYCMILAESYCKRLAAANCKCTDSWNVKGKGSTYNSKIGDAHMSYVSPGF